MDDLCNEQIYMRHKFYVKRTEESLPYRGYDIKRPVKIFDC